jgi:glutathione peroxidase
VVLGFPCNQFGRQEPGTNAEILAFATSKYGVTFPMFAKLEVNGSGAAPLYQFLRQAQPNPDGTTEITWNFTKFLVDRAGEVVKRYHPKVTPEEIGAELARSS